MIYMYHNIVLHIKKNQIINISFSLCGSWVHTHVHVVVSKGFG